MITNINTSMPTETKTTTDINKYNNMLLPNIIINIQYLIPIANHSK